MTGTTRLSLRVNSVGSLYMIASMFAFSCESVLLKRAASAPAWTGNGLLRGYRSGAYKIRRSAGICSSSIVERIWFTERGLRAAIWKSNQPALHRS